MFCVIITSYDTLHVCSAGEGFAGGIWAGVLRCFSRRPWLSAAQSHWLASARWTGWRLFGSVCGGTPGSGVWVPGTQGQRLYIHFL